MKKILITGTGGFIFSNFIRKAVFEKHPYNFISVDKVTKTSVLNNIYQNKHHTFYFGDVADTHFINTLFEYEKPDIVIHGAAESSVDASLKDPNVFIKSNVLGTQVIVNACIKWNVERLIYISTDEVYGQLKSESEPSWTENSPLDPRNPYSASKAAGELVVKAASESFGLKYNITRSSNNYGPRQTCDKLIPKTIKSIVTNTPIEVYGAGLQIRDWTYVLDNCGAILSILKNGKENETYNISANQEMSNIEIIQKICNRMGKGHNLITNIKDPRGSHDFRYSIDTSKVRALGWKPEYSLPEGLDLCVNWFQNNLWWFKE